MAGDKRKNVAAFPVTLWTNRWQSNSVSYFTFPNMDVRGVRGENELPKWIWRDVRGDTVNATQMHKGYNQSLQWNPNCKFLKAIPAFLNVPHTEVCILLGFSAHKSLVTILLKLLCRATSSLSTARHCSLAVQTSTTRSCNIQEIQFAPLILASWNLLIPHLLQDSQLVFRPVTFKKWGSSQIVVPGVISIC